MKPEGPLPCLQQPAKVPYPEAVERNTQPHPISLKYV
jgi:hypothetical protein